MEKIRIRKIEVLKKELIILRKIIINPIIITLYNYIIIEVNIPINSLENFNFNLIGRNNIRTNFNYNTISRPLIRSNCFFALYN